MSGQLLFTNQHGRHVLHQAKRWTLLACVGLMVGLSGCASVLPGMKWGGKEEKPRATKNEKSDIPHAAQAGYHPNVKVD